MHETLQGELFRQGLPAATVARLLDELADHRDDLHMEQKEAGFMATMQEIETRLGEPRMLADYAAAEHRRSYFAGRHPVWFCLVAPIPLTIACWAICLLTLIGFSYVADWVLGKTFGLEGKTEEEWPRLAVGFAYGVVYFLRFGPPILATMWAAWKIRQAGLPSKWLWASGCLFAAIAACFMVQLHLPQANSQGNLTMGLNFPIHISGLFNAVIPLAIVLLFWGWSRKRMVAAE